MLRLTVLLLLLANAAYFAWSQGLLRAWGWRRRSSRSRSGWSSRSSRSPCASCGGEEARRLEAASAGRAKATECLQAGPFEEAQLAGLKQALEPWPAGSWSLEPVVEPARWIVYMGKYATAENISRKKAELRQIGVSFEALADPSLEPGLSLGGFASRGRGQPAARSACCSAACAAPRWCRSAPKLRGQLLKLPRGGRQPAAPPGRAAGRR